MIFTSSDGVTTVTLPGAEAGNALPEMEHWEDFHVAANGAPDVYNHAVTEWWIRLQFRLSNSQRSALRSFFQTATQFGANSFKITPDTGLDLGKGAGTQLTNVRLYSAKFPEKPNAPLSRFEVDLVIRAYSTGTGNPA